MTYDDKLNAGTLIAEATGDSKDYNIFSIEGHFISAET